MSTTNLGNEVLPQTPNTNRSGQHLQYKICVVGTSVLTDRRKEDVVLEMLSMGEIRKS